MLLHVSNRKLLCYAGGLAAIGSVLCFRAGNWSIGGVFLAISGAGFALGWLASQRTGTHS